MDFFSGSCMWDGGFCRCLIDVSLQRRRKGGKRRDLRKHVRGGNSVNYIHTYIHVVPVEVFPNQTSLNGLHMHGGKHFQARKQIS